MVRYVVVLVTALLVGCQPRPPVAETLPTMSPAAALTVSPAAPTTAPTVAPTSPPSPTAAPTVGDPSPGAYLRPLVSSWRPADTTVIVEEHPGGGITRGMTLVAVPPDGQAPTRLITILDGGLFQTRMRPDGGALVVSITVRDDPWTSRLAIWDARTGQARWIVADDPGTFWHRPVWSPDGAFLFVGRTRVEAGGKTFGDLGIWRLRPDGSDLRQVVAGNPPGGSLYASAPLLVTRENILAWGQSYVEATSLLVLDLGTRREARYGRGAFLQSWRPTAPRVLVIHASHVGPLRGLVAWDDQGAATRTLVPDEVEVGGADWDTTGTRVVASALFGDTFALHVMDDRGTTRARLADTAGARLPLWLRAGIVFLAGGAEMPNEEVRVVQPRGGASRRLYRTQAGPLSLQGFVKP